MKPYRTRVFDKTGNELIAVVTPVKENNKEFSVKLFKGKQEVLNNIFSTLDYWDYKSAIKRSIEFYSDNTSSKE